MKHVSFTRSLVIALVLALGAIGARAAVTMQLDRSDIAEDDSAQLTINASGNGSDSVSAPVVAGLQFTAISQSSQIEIINGSVNATSTVTYEVTPQHPGNYTIPSLDPKQKGLALHVHSGSSVANSVPVTTTPPMTPSSSPSTLPQSSIPAPATTVNAPRMVASGAAFTRVSFPKRDLYVGEAVPVEIQVGLRSGMAASLNGLPTLSADAFTLNKLTDKPEEAQEIINGEPYTILTWHSIMAPVKPGDFSLTVQTPVTVQVRTKTRISGMGDMFNDPFFQNFFGGVTQKELTLASDPATLKVLALPTTGQPANFSGAVGQFTASSELSSSSGTVGDPLTLRLKINGAGAFDRVDNAMLSTSNDWKTYRATGKFIPADSVGYRGEKDFEQAIIPQQPGHQTVPPISFSFFNPESRRYETVQTAPINIEVAPGSAVASTAAPASQPAAPAPANGLRPDMTVSGSTVRTLQPLYFQPGFLASQAALALAFIGAGFWLRRNERLNLDPTRATRQQELKAVDRFLAEMDSAAHAGDSTGFFLSARQALQHALAWRWKMAPGAITAAEIESRLNDDGENARRVFALADELAYSGNSSIHPDFAAWKQAVRHFINQTV